MSVYINKKYLNIIDPEYITIHKSEYSHMMATIKVLKEKLRKYDTRQCENCGSVPHEWLNDQECGNCY